MLIRFLTTQDAGAFRDLRLDGLRRHPEAFGSSYEEEVGRSLEEWNARLSGDTIESFVAGAYDEEGLRLIGVIGFYRQMQLKLRHKGIIWGVYVQPQWRGQSVGSKLMEFVLAETAKLEGLERVLLTVEADNASAVKLYERCGFAGYGREPQALRIGSSYHDELLMAKHLSK